MSVQIILVIGATGTVGEPVARQLLADGYHVRLLVRQPRPFESGASSNVSIVAGNRAPQFRSNIPW